MAGLGTPSVAPSTRSALGVARELYAGTAVLPTNTVPQGQRQYDPEDTPKFLPDEAIRGSMAMRYENIQGPEDATFSFGGPVFLDTYGFFLDNCFGDLSTTGSSPANGTSLGGSVATLAIGGTQCTVNSATGYATASTVIIDSGNISEAVVLSAVSGTLLTFGNYPLRFPHNAGATVNTVSGPYTHTFALLNSALGYGGAYGSQPPTHTITDIDNLNYGTVNTSGARAYPSACVQSIDFTGQAEALLSVRFSGNSWLSQPASTAPTITISTVIPQAAWQSQVYVGGTASGNQVTTVGDWAINVKRTLQTYWTTQGEQNPYIIGRGQLDITGTMTFTVPADETPLYYMLNNTQPLVQIVLDNGLTGTSHLRLVFRCSQASFTKSKPGRNAILVDYQASWSSVANTSDTGGSGGLGPGIFQLVNNLGAY
jgi:hypothetical protein